MFKFSPMKTCKNGLYRKYDVLVHFKPFPLVFHFESRPVVKTYNVSELEMKRGTTNDTKFKSNKKLTKSDKNKNVHNASA